MYGSSQLVCFSSDPGFSFSVKTQHNIAKFKSFDNFIEESMDCAYFVIDGSNTDYARHLLSQIRCHKQYYLYPAFVINHSNHELSELSDGLYSNVDIEKYCITTYDLIDTLPNIETDSTPGEHRLLRYLFTRPQKRISPEKNWHAISTYLFPLVECFKDDDNNIDHFRFLDSLVQRKLLAGDQLIDRIRCCTRCEASHLGFVDTCPNCSHIDIVQKPFLHCFACGHVAPQESFISQEKLQCPNCQEKLRHIGNDYDRPLESHCCNHCTHKFIAPKVVAKCQVCDHATDPQQLIAKQIQSYAITEFGRMTVRHSNIDNVYSIFDNLNYTNPTYFNQMLNWIMKLSIRHQETSFSLIGIKFTNLATHIERFGYHDTYRKLENCAEIIRDTIRSTDLSTRTTENSLWLLLPNTNQSGCDVLARKLAELEGRWYDNDNEKLNISLLQFTSIESLSKDDTAELLIAKLNCELEGM